MGVININHSGIESAITLTSNGSALLVNGSAIGGGATGGGTDAIFSLNDQVVTTSYTIPSGKNAFTAGPVSVANTATVTISSGSTWVIV